VQEDINQTPNAYSKGGRKLMDFTWIKSYPEYDYQFSSSSPKGMAYFFRLKDETGTIIFPEAIVQENQILFQFVSHETGTIDEDITKASAWFRTLFEDVKNTFRKKMNKLDSETFLKMHPYREGITSWDGDKKNFYFSQHMFSDKGKISIPINARHEDKVTFSFEERYPQKTITDFTKMPVWFQSLVEETKRRVTRETRIRNLFTESR
jgi:hypothetical protein